MDDELVRLIERSKVAFPKFGSGVSPAAITRAEVALGLPLPTSFKWWLRNYGIGQIKGDILYGLDECDDGRPDIVELARMNQRDGLYGADHLVFLIGNCENFFFDTVNAGAGEYPVFLHDIAQDEEIPYATDFAAF